MNGKTCSAPNTSILWHLTSWGTVVVPITPNDAQVWEKGWNIPQNSQQKELNIKGRKGCITNRKPGISPDTNPRNPILCTTNLNTKMILVHHCASEIMNDILWSIYTLRNLCDFALDSTIIRYNKGRGIVPGIIIRSVLRKVNIVSWNSGKVYENISSFENKWVRVELLMMLRMLLIRKKVHSKDDTTSQVDTQTAQLKGAVIQVAFITAPRNYANLER